MSPALTRTLCAALLFLSGAAHGAELTQIKNGETLFRKQCGMCHLTGGFGSNMLERRGDGLNPLLAERGALLTRDYVHQAVRKGVGSMPRFTPAELTDQGIDDIAAYLMRNKTP